MGESEDQERAKTPEWQREVQKSPSTAVPIQSDEPPSEPSDILLLEQARKFLDEDSIRSASRERKVAFLQKKGLQPDDIQKLLGHDSDAFSPGTTNHAPESEPELKTIHDSNENPSVEAQPLADPAASPPAPAQNAMPATPNRDIPPIITYPEFLLRPQKPPPLVTLQRLSYAAYGIAGISSLTYGASKYLIEPMLEALNGARHELAATALQDLDKFNAKLEARVSHVPYLLSSGAPLKQKSSGVGGILEDDISIDSDPTELFHRDMAVQTSPPPRSRSSSLSLSFSDVDVSQPAKDPTAHQAAGLVSLRSSLSSLLAPHRSESTSSFSSVLSHPAEANAPTSLQSALSDLQATLDTMQFQNQFAAASAYQDIYGDGRDSRKINKAKAGADGADAKEDEALKFKTEIRALKGLLLSARNFPTGRLATTTTTTTTTTQAHASGGLVGAR